MLAQCSSNRLGVGRALPAPDDGAGIVDDANGGRLERNVEADIMALLIHAFLRVAFDTAELTGLLGSSRCLRLRHVPSLQKSGYRSARSRHLLCTLAPRIPNR